MKISVAIAAFRGEKFIGELIDSLLNQHLLPDEIIITDDSPDNLTRQAIESFAESKCIHYTHNEKPLGVNGNFAKAISLCSGEIIFLCDQDDVWLPEKIFAMVKKLEDFPEADAIFCNSTAVNEKLEPLDFSLWEMREFNREMKRNILDGNALEIFAKRVTCSTHNIAFRKRMLPYLLPFPELDPFYADTWIALRIASIGQWTILDEELTLYRIHSSNLSAPSLPGIADQAAMSRKARAKNSVAKTAELGNELLSRLPANASEKTKKTLLGFRKHYLIRSRFSRIFPFRAIQMIPEILSLRYSRYSNGWKSIAADLFLFR